MRVFVHRNLTKDCWSVRDERTGRIVLHTKRLVLADAVLVVQKAGRARVLREKRKNVHAGVRGRLVRGGKTGPAFRKASVEAIYNPYKAATFTTLEGIPLPSDRPFTRVELAFVRGKPKVYVESPSLADLIGSGAHLWESDKDFDKFLRGTEGKD